MKNGLLQNPGLWQKLRQAQELPFYQQYQAWICLRVWIWIANQTIDLTITLGVEK
jgi:hypothetical protein